jgi:hypothetical protein
MWKTCPSFETMMDFFVKREKLRNFGDENCCFRKKSKIFSIQPIPVVLSQLSGPCCHVLVILPLFPILVQSSRLTFQAYLPRLTCPDCPVRVVLSQMSYPSCPALIVPSPCLVLAFLTLLSCYWQSVSYPGTIPDRLLCPIPAFLSQVSYPDYLVPAVLYHPSDLAVLSTAHLILLSCRY